VDGAAMSTAQSGRLSPPDFGLVIRRERQCSALQRLLPRLVFVCAPGGYGKSVLASQFAGSDAFDSVMWIRFNDEVMQSGDLERAVSAALSDLRTSPSASSVDSPAETRASLAEAWFDRTGGGISRMCLVLDGPRLASAGDYSSSIGYLMNARRPVTHVVVTTRDPQPPQSLAHLCTLLEPSDLAFDRGEAMALVYSLVDSLPPEEAEDLLRSTSGQPALLSVLARARSMRPYGDRVGATAGLKALLNHLAESQLSPDQHQQLVAAAMLGHGTAEDIALVCQCDREAVDIGLLGATLPLIRVGSEGTTQFEVHDLARECFGSRADLIKLGTDDVRRACCLLAERGEAHHALALLHRAADMSALAQFSERWGVEIVEQGRQSVVAAALDMIGPEAIVGSPGLLMTRAHLHWVANRLGDARQCVSSALAIAEHGSDGAAVAAALFLRARLCVPSGDLAGVRENMELALRTPTLLALRDQAVAHAYAGLGAGFSGDLPCAFEHLARAEEIASRAGPSSSVARIRVLKSAVLGTVVGDEASAYAELIAPECENAAISVRVLAVGNAGTAALEMGRLHSAEALTRQSLALCEQAGLEPQRWSGLSTLAGIAVTNGRLGHEADSYESLTARLVETGDIQSAAINAAYTAVLARSLGSLDESLRQVESIVPLLGGRLGPIIGSLVHLERAASLLALGDVAPAAREAQRIHDVVVPIGARYLHLKADLILAEAECRSGDSASAVARVAEHAEYILSENPNWMLAMYIRAFPRLLGVVAKAVGPSELPSHMLSMILPAYAEPAIAAASSVLEPRRLSALSQRLLGRKGSGRRISDLPREDVCRVRLFGGMEVITQDGPVAAKAWRKRKARLLFAMLAVRRGGDVPTDQVLDYLWPEFPEDKALNNMYVVWSAMKHALSPDLDRGEPCPYVERVGTVCRLVRANVTTDLDEFEERLAEGKKADHAGDPEAAIAAFRDVMEVYRGELLPGDAYDDWFRSARDRCKHEYSDAALRLASLLDSGGDVAEALQVLRQALVHDPWREDLYQAVLRRQISEGQRSAAIETYLNCRSRLTEDLGIDPSAATTKLYQHVLAMEYPDDQSEWGSVERAINDPDMILPKSPHLVRFR
jgi:DNA-binding SARP family transcriptional activator